MNDPRIGEVAGIAALVTVDVFFPESQDDDLPHKLATAITAAIETYVVLYAANEIPAQLE
jgi:hypothetical protein